MTTITLKLTRTIIAGDAGDAYRVLAEIVATEGVPLTLFVNTVEPDAYSHIATMTDLQSWPESREEAINLGLDYYRRLDARRDFTTVTDALHFIRVVREQLNYLATTNDDLATEFVGTDTTVIPST